MLTYVYSSGEYADGSQHGRQVGAYAGASKDLGESLYNGPSTRNDRLPLQHLHPPSASPSNLLSTGPAKRDQRLPTVSSPPTQTAAVRVRRSSSVRFCFIDRLSRCCLTCRTKHANHCSLLSAEFPALVKFPAGGLTGAPTPVKHGHTGAFPSAVANGMPSELVRSPLESRARWLGKL